VTRNRATATSTTPGVWSYPSSVAQVTSSRVAAVLRGERSYDSVGKFEQALVRAVWEQRITELRSELDLAPEFTAAGRAWVEADESGRPVRRRPSTSP
jgi:hypothetical protein